MVYLVPPGTPGFLIPIIEVIEAVIRVIRPATLAIQLAANIVAGNLLFTLLGTQNPSPPVINLVLMIAGLIILLIEGVVTCTQSYGLLF